MSNTVELYRFEDLSREAQIEALHTEREKTLRRGYLWADECFDSLFAYYDHFGIEPKEIKVCFWDIEKSYVKTKRKSKYSQILSAERIQALRACNGMLTGYCMDTELYAALNECIYSGEENPNAIARHLYDKWIKAAREDADICLTEDYIQSWFDHIEAWFDHKGKLFSSKY